MLQITLPQTVCDILNTLENAGFEAYAVGGCVRDLYMCKQPSDYDICTAALPCDMKNIFKNERIVPTGEKHGTLTLIKDGTPYEITTFRADGTYSDARHPGSVRLGVPLSDDLKRRDFTVNAMAFSQRRGLVDLYGGKADIAAKTLRCVGDANERFTEDALRIMRLARFASQLGFKAEKNTFNAAVRNKSLLKLISAERVCAELSRLVMGEYAAQTLIEYNEILFEILGDANSEKWKNAADNIDKAPQQLSMRLALLSKAVGTRFLSRLRFDKKTATEALTIYNNLNTHFEDDKCNALHALNKFGMEILSLILEAQTACGKDNTAFTATVRKCVSQNECYTLKSLAVNGTDVAKAGYADKEIGTMLNGLLEEVMSGRVKNDRKILLSALEQKL